MRGQTVKIINETGILDVGFCSFSAISDRLIECAAKKRLPVNAKTVIVCLFPYKVKDTPPENISRYAAVPDYHKICGEILEKAAQRLREEYKENKFTPFIDNSPLPEVFAAATAGLGVMGDNELLITEKWGSWCFIGEIVTDLALRCDDRFSRCKACGACAQVCPKGDGECLSAVSQKKGELTERESRLLKKHEIVWGCDLCAEVCLLNRGAGLTTILPFREGYRNNYTPGEDITGRAYEWRGDGTVRRNFENLK